MITYQIEPFSSFIQDGMPLIEKHWDEVALHKEWRPLDIDYKRYFQADEIGLIKCFTARRDGKLIGYILWALAGNLHYKTHFQAHCDIYYLVDEERKGLSAVRMFKEAHKYLKKLGVVSVYYHDKIHKTRRSFFEYLGASAFETHYELNL